MRIGFVLFGVLTAFASYADCVPMSVVRDAEPSLLPEGKRFELVWNDEFNGNQLDEKKWCYRTNFWGRSAHWFAKPQDGCVEVKDGLLHLKIKKLANGQFVSPQLQTGELIWDIPHDPAPTGLWPLPKRQPPKFLHRYGYYECRCRLQQLPGWWSAFWMQSPAQGTTIDERFSGIEHDIMESFEPGVVIPACFHYDGYGAEYNMFQIPAAEKGKDFSLKLDKAKFHVFGMLWTEKGYWIYVDGKLRGFNNQAVSQVPEFILLTTEVKSYRDNRMTGKAHPALEKTAAAGDDFVIDYVRVFDLISDGTQL